MMLKMKTAHMSNNRKMEKELILLKNSQSPITRE